MGTKLTITRLPQLEPLLLLVTLWTEPVKRTRTTTISTTNSSNKTTISSSKTNNTINSSNNKTTSSTIKIKTKSQRTATTTSSLIHTSPRSVKMLAGIVINLPLNSAKRRVWSRTVAAVTKAEMSV